MIRRPPRPTRTNTLFPYTTLFPSGDYAWLAILAGANTVISLYYYLRVIGPMYLRPAEGRVHSLGLWTTSATWLGTVAILAIGLGAEAGLSAFAVAPLLPYRSGQQPALQPHLSHRAIAVANVTYAHKNSPKSVVPTKTQ